MKRHATTMALCLGLAAHAASYAQNVADSLVYIGTRGEPPAATAPQGIYAARLDSATGKLTPLGMQVELVRAIWLANHPTLPVIYSTGRAPGGAEMVAAGRPEAQAIIHGFRVDTASGKLLQINQAAAGALLANHLAVDGKSNTLFVSGFESGVVTALPLSPDGGVGTMVSSQKHYGSGPHPRQKSAHPHSVVVDPTQRFLLSPDLGSDRIFVHRFDGATRALAPGEPPFEQLPPGSAPRHPAFHPNGRFFYINTELTAELRVYRWDAKQGRLLPVQTVSTYPDGYAGTNRSSSEIAFSRDGRFLYVALRGDQDSMVVYAVNSSTGSLNEIQRTASQGKRPWSFGIDPSGRWLLVANEGTNSVNVFSVDRVTGKVSATSESLPIPNPAAFAFYPN